MLIIIVIILLYPNDRHCVFDMYLYMLYAGLGLVCYPEQHEELVHLVSRLLKIIIIIIIIFIVGGSFHFISFRHRHIDELANSSGSLCDRIPQSPL